MNTCPLFVVIFAVILMKCERISSQAVCDCQLIKSPNGHGIIVIYPLGTKLFSDDQCICGDKNETIIEIFVLGAIVEPTELPKTQTTIAENDPTVVTDKPGLSQTLATDDDLTTGRTSTPNGTDARSSSSSSSSTSNPGSTKSTPNTTSPTSNSTSPAPCSSSPTPVSTTPTPKSTKPTACATNSTRSSTKPTPSSTTPTPGSMKPTPGFTTPNCTTTDRSQIDKSTTPKNDTLGSAQSTVGPSILKNPRSVYKHSNHPRLMLKIYFN